MGGLRSGYTSYTDLLSLGHKLPQILEKLAALDGCYSRLQDSVDKLQTYEYSVRHRAADA
jgi:hypothetical protein